MFREVEVQFWVQLHAPVTFPARQKARNREWVGSRARLYSTKTKTSAAVSNQILVTWLSCILLITLTQLYLFHGAWGGVVVKALRY